MNKMVIAAVTAIGLGMSVAAFAQGVPPNAIEHYGTLAFTDHSHDPQVHFLGKGTVFARIFGHSGNSQPVVDRTAVRNAAPANGG